MPILYDIELDDYHRSKHISSSKLGDYASRGPRYYASRYVTGNAPAFEATEALEFGQAFEDLVCFGEKAFSEKYALKPEGMNFANKEGKAWQAEHKDKVIIKHDDLEAMRTMREALLENDVAATVLRKATQQATIRGEFAGTPGLQSRPDFLLLDGCLASGYQPATFDLKTTISFSKFVSGRAVADYRYHAQAALCTETLRQCDVRALNFLVACEKVPPFRCVVVRITDDWVEAGWRWCHRQLEKIAAHHTANEWPRVDSDVISLPPAPPWVAGVSDESEEDAA